MIIFHNCIRVCKSERRAHLVGTKLVWQIIGVKGSAMEARWSQSRSSEVLASLARFLGKSGSLLSLLGLLRQCLLMHCCLLPQGPDSLQVYCHDWISAASQTPSMVSLCYHTPVVTGRSSCSQSALADLITIQCFSKGIWEYQEM